MLTDTLAAESALPLPTHRPGVVVRIMAASVEIAAPFMVTAALLGVFAFPLFYVVWSHVFPQPYENLWLRLGGSLLCLPLVFKDRWPERLTRFVPVYWQLTILYTLAFFFSYLALRNGMNQVWLLSMIAAAFVLTFLVEWRSAILLFALGSALAWLVYQKSDQNPVQFGFYLQHLVIFLFPLTFGGIINHKLQQYRRMQSAFDKRLRHITNENARMMHEQNKLLSRFLSNTIVTRLWQSQRKHGLDHAIAAITRQEKRFCGIMQADVRNFTKLFGHESEIEIAQLIRRCYTEITEIGQDLAVIKPIGDCIFMYSDDLSGRQNAVVNILALGVFFVDSVERVNRLLVTQGISTLNFGIGMHAGEVIYGNLASDTLIDPTIIGIHVNMTARLEELTKVPAVKALIGNNAIILSEEIAEYGRNFLPPGALLPIELEALNLHVRDFHDVKRVYALTYDTARAYYGRAMEHIESQRRRLTEPIGNMEVNSYRGISYYYHMQGAGPSTSWTTLIDVGALPARAVRHYATQFLRDLDFEIDRSDGRWLVVTTSEQPGEYDETDVEARIFGIIDGLQQVAQR
jgi:class 3 adenylate cyclase